MPGNIPTKPAANTQNSTAASRAVRAINGWDTPAGYHRREADYTYWIAPRVRREDTLSSDCGIEIG
jgi:hypothetical protein